jgi:PTH1 family peptidyl-tRNA hydrolase
VIIVGLGNPGDRYRATRHNVGFRVLEQLAERWGRPAFRSKFAGELATVESRGKHGPEKHYLLKPQTYMNVSGDSVQPAMAFFRLSPADLLVVHDELDLPFGRLLLKSGGGSGGHNGLKSITARLGTDAYKRLRVGIGRPPADFRGDVADFVLQAFPPPEDAALIELLDRASDAVEMLLDEGMEAAMNRVNRRTAS